MRRMLSDTLKNFTLARVAVACDRMLTSVKILVGECAVQVQCAIMNVCIIFYHKIL